ncbi:SwmB domain-containing protein [Amycolatopsis taiwanensis]|nr:SwmB domain-containing protein [Amycolatopsis taiwanensis]
MNLKRKVGLFLALTLVSTGLPLLSASTASAAGGNGAIQVIGACGDILNLRERVAGSLIVTITIPSSDPNEVWTLTAQQQDYNAVTGGREGNPVDIVPNPMPTLAFSLAEGGFTTTANFTDTSGLTHGYSYTATRTSPTPLTCTTQGFWTTPANTPGPVAPPNPIGRPDTPPALTGATEADSGSNDVLLQFDQEMLDTAQGIPAASRFQILVNGVARTVTGVQVVNDSPPADAVVDVTFDGAALASGQTVSVTYRKPLSANQAQLQDIDGNTVANFGPIAIPAF